MKTSNNLLVIIFGLVAVGMLALIPLGVFAMSMLTAPAPQPVDTQATVQAIMTQNAIQMTLNAPTPIPPTQVVVQATNTPAPILTVNPPTATPLSYCDWVAFIKDVTIPDGTITAPNEPISKTWRLKNRGTCTWTSDYMLVFSGGTKMGDTTAVRLPGNVLPGQTVDVTVMLTPPSSDGEYTSYWMLRNPSGALFGTGEKANTPFYVNVKVRKPEPQLQHGTVGGNLCYPSEFNPPMTLYFENLATAERIQFSIGENENVYSVLLPAGKYYVWAWAPNYNLEGAYTYENGIMKPFLVEGGMTTPFINLCNWSPYPHSRAE